MLLVIRRNATSDFSIFVSETLLKKEKKDARISAFTYLSLIPLGSRAGTALNVNVNETCLTSRALLTLLKIGAMK